MKWLSNVAFQRSAQNWQFLAVPKFLPLSRICPTLPLSHIVSFDLILTFVLLTYICPTLPHLSHTPMFVPHSHIVLTPTFVPKDPLNDLIIGSMFVPLSHICPKFSHLSHAPMFRYPTKQSSRISWTVPYDAHIVPRSWFVSHFFTQRPIFSHFPHMLSYILCISHTPLFCHTFKILFYPIVAAPAYQPSHPPRDSTEMDLAGRACPKNERLMPIRKPAPSINRSKTWKVCPVEIRSDQWAHIDIFLNNSEWKRMTFLCL